MISSALTAMHRLARLDQRFVWHPFTQMRDWLRREPTVIVSGRGAVLRFADFALRGRLGVALGRRRRGGDGRARRAGRLGRLHGGGARRGRT